jgi:hypothetical protein
MLGKCEPDNQEQGRAIFEREPFGELVRLVTQKLSDGDKRVAKEELVSENWLRLAASLSGWTHERMQVTILESLETDVLHFVEEAVQVSTAGSFQESKPALLWTGRHARGSGSNCGPPGTTSSNCDVTPDGGEEAPIR